MPILEFLVLTSLRKNLRDLPQLLNNTIIIFNFDSLTQSWWALQQHIVSINGNKFKWLGKEKNAMAPTPPCNAVSASSD